MAKILLVEDNELNRDMLSRRLIRRGYEIIMAFDGEEGVRAAKEHSPNLILMDMSLPVIDGWEATRQVRADNVTKNIPIIALTAHAMQEDKQRALDAGCNDFDTKPVDLNRLIDKMDKLLHANGS